MEIQRVSTGGHWYTVYIQEWGADCGPTSVAIARQHLTGLGTEIDWLRKKSKAPLVSPGIEAKIDALGLQSRDYGTDALNLPALAKEMNLRATYSFQSSLGLVDTLKTAGHHKCFIVHVEWSGGGGHFVVVPHVTDAGSCVVLDPYYGLQVTPTAPSYRFTAADGSEVTGRFSGHLVEVSG